MIRSIFRAITARVGGLQRAAFWLALFSGLSLLLGFVRDRILAHYFGAGAELDMYYAAFEIPDILFVTAASVVSASILVPMFSLRAGDEKKLRSFINSVFSYFSIFIVFSCLLAFIFMPELVKVFFGGFDASAGIVVDIGLNLQDLLIIHVTPIREGETILADYILIRIFLAVLL